MNMNFTRLLLDARRLGSCRFYSILNFLFIEKFFVFDSVLVYYL
jgi:hypothetical protein